MVLVEVEVSDEDDEHHDGKQKKASQVKEDVDSSFEEKEAEKKAVEGDEEVQKEAVEDGEPELDAEMVVVFRCCCGRLFIVLLQVPQNGYSAVASEVRDIEITVNEVETEAEVENLDNGQEQHQFEKIEEDVKEKEVVDKEEVVEEDKMELELEEKQEVVQEGNKVEETVEKSESEENKVDVEMKIVSPVKLVSFALCIITFVQDVDPDAENISEDELPGVQVAKVPETEEVSDEELPGPKRAELPADTEVKMSPVTGNYRDF